MLDAICTYGESNRTFSILGFQELSELDIEKLRKHLECPECKGKAYYRKESIDGKAACFGSRYHHDTCSEGRSSPQREKEVRHALEMTQIIANSRELVFDFSPKALSSEEPSKTRQVNLAGQKRIRTDSNSNSIKQTRASTIGMEKSLNSLMRGSDLANSEALIEVDEGYKYKAKNLFVNFSNAEATDNVKDAKPKMYWGTISHTDPDMNWLNPLECNDIGIPIQKYKDKFLKRFNFKNKRDLEGAGVILFGKCFWNNQRTRKIIELWNADRIYISLAEE